MAVARERWSLSSRSAMAMLRQLLTSDARAARPDIQRAPTLRSGSRADPRRLVAGDLEAPGIFVSFASQFLGVVERSNDNVATLATIKVVAVVPEHPPIDAVVIGVDLSHQLTAHNHLSTRRRTRSGTARVSSASWGVFDVADGGEFDGLSWPRGDGAD